MCTTDMQSEKIVHKKHLEKANTDITIITPTVLSSHLLIYYYLFTYYWYAWQEGKFSNCLQNNVKVN